MKRPRGRPREYDPEEALDAAMGVFWARGYAATSLTDLSEATGMNRPSLYAAFGDKRSVFLRALHRYSARMAREVGQALAAVALGDLVAQHGPDRAVDVADRELEPIR